MPGWRNGRRCGLKSSARRLTYCYQTILSSIYRRFSRQSMLTSCFVSLGDPRIFHASLDQRKERASRRCVPIGRACEPSSSEEDDYYSANPDNFSAILTVARSDEDYCFEAEIRAVAALSAWGKHGIEELKKLVLLGSHERQAFYGDQLVQFEGKRHSCLKLAVAFRPLVAGNDLQKYSK